MKKMLLIFIFLATTCLCANATTKPRYYNFGFTGYCDTFSFYTYSAYEGAPAVAISGTHHCGQFPIENVGGFVHALSSYYQVGSGTVFDFHDSEYSDWFGEPGFDTDWIVNWKAGTWVLYVSNGGMDYYFTNSGTITVGFEAATQAQSQGDKTAAQP